MVSKWITPRSGLRHCASLFARSFFSGTWSFGFLSITFFSRCRQLLRSAHSLALSKSVLIYWSCDLNLSISFSADLGG